MPLISVIVPVYKVEAYLPACVDSILAQTFCDFELILVDDGSPDACGEMCDQYARQDARIRVIHQENGGLSAARNAGLDIAQGNYITFVDSDDMVAPDFLEVLYASLERSNAAVACCCFQSFEDDVPPRRHNAEIHSKTMTGHAAVLSVYNATGDVSVTAWGKLFQKELLRDRRFPIGKIHEDQALIPVVLCNAATVVTVDAELYYYRDRPGSIMNKAFSEKRFDNMEGIDGCIRYFQEEGYHDLVAAAKRVRKKVNAILVIDAHSGGAANLIPRKYRLTKLRAVYYCCKYAPRNTCSWYLAKIDTKIVRYYEYYVKIKSLFSKSV